MHEDDPIEAIATALLRYLRERGADLDVVRFAGPEELAESFGAIGLDLNGPQPALSPDALVGAVETVLTWAVRTQHPRFFNQNFAGADPVAVMGDWLIAALNTSAATYEMAPVFTMMERAALARMADLVGFTPFDGVFGPGGSLNNLFAMQLARHRRVPEAKQRGDTTRWAVFVSERAHYSFRKATSLLGMGTDALITVACDPTGAMDPAALQAAIADTDRVPLMIGATAGSTVLGAFDPLDALADIAAEHSLWLHVDGCYGASTLVSERWKHLMAGVERADSLAWNPHKLLGVTQQCSALLTRHPGLLTDAFASGADYIFQTDKLYSELDSGDKTFVCGRRADVVKLWLTWKARGDAGLEARVDHVFDLAAHLARRLRDDPRFVIASPPSFTHVCFWWVPPDLRPFSFDASTEEERLRLHRVAPVIKDQMQREGTAMVGFQPLGERPNFFRMLFINPAVTPADVDAVIELIDRYGMAAFG